jgi:hypothetical protein
MNRPTGKTVTIPDFVVAGNTASTPEGFTRDPKFAAFVEGQRKKAVELFAEPAEGLNKAVADKG